LIYIADLEDQAGQDWNQFKQQGIVSPHWRLEGMKTRDCVNIRDGANHTRHLTNQAEHDAIKGVGGSWFGDYAESKANGTISPGRSYGKGSRGRKMASAQSAKIPFPLAQYIARYFKP